MRKRDVLSLASSLSQTVFFNSYNPKARFFFSFRKRRRRQNRIRAAVQRCFWIVSASDRKQCDSTFISSVQNEKSHSLSTFLQKQSSLLGIIAKQTVKSQLGVLYPSNMEVDSTQENGSSGGQDAVTEQVDSKAVSTMS